MKIKIFLFFCLPFCLYSSQTIVYDIDFSPYSGSYNLLLGESALLAYRDCFGTKDEENTTLKIVGRVLEQGFVWDIINATTTVVQHEVFGHGYRLRSLNQKIFGYEIAPYEGGTFFQLDPSFKVGELLAVDVAGLEAEAILARRVKLHWISKGSIDGRLSTLYTGAEQSLFWYTLLTKGQIDGGEEIAEGNDVKAYIDLLNAYYPDSDLTIGDLTRIAFINWADPMTFYAYFSWIYYVSLGKSWTFPMIRITDKIKYLPNALIGYAPYGVEGYFENFFSIEGRPLYIYFKGGKRSFGFGSEYHYLLTSSKGALGGKFDVWNQNRFLTSATIEDLAEGKDISSPALNTRTWGMAASLISRFYVSTNFGFFAELGGKTAGYLPGYSLSGGLVLRVGLSVKN